MTSPDNTISSFESVKAALEIVECLPPDEAFDELRLVLASLPDGPLRRWAVSQAAKQLGLPVPVLNLNLRAPCPPG